MAELSAESELLLLLSRQQVTDTQMARVRTIISQDEPRLDWGHFAVQAARHRVAPSWAGISGAC